MARESPARLLLGALQLACLARGSREGVSPSQGEEQPGDPLSSLQSLHALPAFGVTKQPTSWRAGRG